MATVKGQKVDPSDAMLYEGANLSQMCQLFRMDQRTLKARMYGIAACGERNGVPIYPVHEVVKKLYTPTEKQFIEMIPRLRHQDLPKELTKEFWAGLKSRQGYELTAGQLWKTEEVVAALGDVLKLVKMNAQLFVDEIERTTELSDKQRGIISERVKALLLATQRSVTDHCDKKRTEDGQRITDEHLQGLSSVRDIEVRNDNEDNDPL